LVDFTNLNSTEVKAFLSDLTTMIKNAESQDKSLTQNLTLNSKTVSVVVRPVPESNNIEIRIKR
jgi:hypothetical protein